MFIRLAAISCIILPVCAGSPAAAESKAGEDGTRFSLKDFSFRVGIYDISADTSIRLDALDGLIGTTIDLESDLSMDDQKSTSYLSLAWRMSGRHFLELEYFNLNRRGASTLTGQIEFGDHSFDFGFEVTTFFDTKITRVSYAYLLKDTKTYKFALSAGLHITDLNTGISEINSQFGNAEVAVATVTAPLPVIGMSGAWRLNDKWLMYGRLQVFRFTVDDFSGSLEHASVKLEYDAFEHLGIGVGYDLFDLDLDIDRKRWNGNVSFRFHGPLLFLKGKF